ncbi:MAG TPA: methyltransferase domain-containing protein [Gaiellaceae bacterium]
MAHARWRAWNVRRKLRLRFVKSKFGLETVRNYREDRRWGGWCGGEFGSSFTGGIYGTSSANYSMLEELFDEENGVTITPSDVLVDVGCGRGRVINHWLGLGLDNKIVGIELEERWATEAARRLASFPNVTIVHGDALEALPPDGTIFYLFNPFGAGVLRRFKDRLIEVVDGRTDITIVYHFAMHARVFEEDPNWTVEPVRRKTFHPSMIVRKAAVSPAVGT